MALKIDDLTPEAHNTMRLQEGFRQYAVEQLSDVYGYTRAEIRAGLEHHYFGSPGGVEDFVLREFKESWPQSGVKGLKLNIEIETGFVRKLRRGWLRSWAREGSPLAPQRKVPHSAWWILWPDSLHKGIVTGPRGIELFDVQIAPQILVPLLPPVGRPGPKSRMHLIEPILIRRRRAGVTERSKEREAVALEGLYKGGYPEDLRPPSAKTIRLWLCKPEGDRAWNGFPAR